MIEHSRRLKFLSILAATVASLMPCCAGTPEMQTTYNSAASPSDDQNSLRILKPGDGEAVVELPLVEGVTRNSTDAIWVIVHPMETGDYWVQQHLTVRKEGGKATWAVQVHVGRPGKIDVGKHFEIMAVSNPKDPLAEGKVLPDWPDAESKSQPVRVTRRNP